MTSETRLSIISGPHAPVLAAGAGSRMRRSDPGSAHDPCGRPGGSERDRERAAALNRELVGLAEAMAHAEERAGLTRLGVDKTWDDATKTKGNLDVYKPNTVRGGHAVAIVGYKTDRFIVRNSWGTGWGDKGFGYASLAYAQDAFTEAYGVSP